MITIGRIPQTLQGCFRPNSRPLACHAVRGKTDAIYRKPVHHFLVGHPAVFVPQIMNSTTITDTHCRIHPPFSPVKI